MCLADGPDADDPIHAGGRQQLVPGRENEVADPGLVAVEVTQLLVMGGIPQIHAAVLVGSGLEFGVR